MVEKLGQIVSEGKKKKKFRVCRSEKVGGRQGDKRGGKGERGGDLSPVHPSLIRIKYSRGILV